MKLARPEVGGRDTGLRALEQHALALELLVERVDVADLDPAACRPREERLGTRADRAFGQVFATAPFVVRRGL